MGKYTKEEIEKARKNLEKSIRWVGRDRLLLSKRQTEELVEKLNEVAK